MVLSRSVSQADQNLAGQDAQCDSSALLARNHAWARTMQNVDPGFFLRGAEQQNPRYFWIGCSDSRVSATQVLNLNPGEIFVHRNVANLAPADDPNFSASLQYAVEALEVSHILVVGHYGCGGIRAAMEAATDDPVGDWLTPIRDLHAAHGGSCGAEDADCLSEYNVRAQVEALACNAIVLGAWKKMASLTIHGWVYLIDQGILKPVCAPVSGGIESRE